MAVTYSILKYARQADLITEEHTIGETKGHKSYALYKQK